jgi:hypothetical protein
MLKINKIYLIILLNVIKKKKIKNKRKNKSINYIINYY